MDEWFLASFPFFPFLISLFPFMFICIMLVGMRLAVAKTPISFQSRGYLMVPSLPLLDYLSYLLCYYLVSAGDTLALNKVIVVFFFFWATDEEMYKYAVGGFVFQLFSSFILFSLPK